MIDQNELTDAIQQEVVDEFCDYLSRLELYKPVDGTDMQYKLQFLQSFDYISDRKQAYSAINCDSKNELIRDYDIKECDIEEPEFEQLVKTNGVFLPETVRDDYSQRHFFAENEEDRDEYNLSTDSSFDLFIGFGNSNTANGGRRWEIELPKPISRYTIWTYNDIDKRYLDITRLWKRIENKTKLVYGGTKYSNLNAAFIRFKGKFKDFVYCKCIYIGVTTNGTLISDPDSVPESQDSTQTRFAEYEHFSRTAFSTNINHELYLGFGNSNTTNQGSYWKINFTREVPIHVMLYNTVSHEFDEDLDDQVITQDHKSYIIGGPYSDLNAGTIKIILKQ